jgi:hypothetical protein
VDQQKDERRQPEGDRNELEQAAREICRHDDGSA